MGWARHVVMWMAQNVVWCLSNRLWPLWVDHIETKRISDVAFHRTLRSLDFACYFSICVMHGNGESTHSVKKSLSLYVISCCNILMYVRWKKNTGNLFSFEWEVTFFCYSSRQNTIDFLAEWILQKISVHYGRYPCKPRICLAMFDFLRSLIHTTNFQENPSKRITKCDFYVFWNNVFPKFIVVWKSHVLEFALNISCQDRK